MAKFDKYSGEQSSSRLPISAKKSGEVSASSQDRNEKYVAKAKAAAASGININNDLSNRSFVMALDATGSMASLISDARRNLTTIMQRIHQEAKTKVRIRLFAYRDYDVSQGVCEFSPLTADPKELEQWLASVAVHGGGANDGEAIEAMLEAVYSANEASAVLLAGDEPSNNRLYLNSRGFDETLTAHDWARRFAQKGVPIHTFAVGQDPRTIKDFQKIAQLAGGQAGRLDGSAAMIDMAVMAMLSSLKGRASVRRYMEGHSLSDGAKEFGNLLLAGPKS